MRKALTLGSAVMLAAVLVVSGYLWAASDMGTSGGTASETSKSKDSAKKKSEKSSSSTSDMSSSDMQKGMKGGGGDENTKKVQEALKDKGQDPGPIDGVMGPKTKAAIKAYQSANKMKATGRLDAETAKSLGVEAGASSSPSSSEKASKSSSKSDKSGSSDSGTGSTTKKSSSSSSSSDTGSSSSFSDLPSGRNAPSSRDKK
jgi:peptidoglycan hydrolase-like protein with peptidoglycan-binding domain